MLTKTCQLKRQNKNASNKLTDILEIDSLPRYNNLNSQKSLAYALNCARLHKKLVDQALD